MILTQLLQNAGPYTVASVITGTIVAAVAFRNRRAHTVPAPRAVTAVPPILETYEQEPIVQPPPLPPTRQVTPHQPEEPQLPTGPQHPRQTPTRGASWDWLTEPDASSGNN